MLEVSRTYSDISYTHLLMSIIFLLYSSDVSFYLHNLISLSSFVYLIEEQKFPNPISIISNYSK